MISWKMNDHTMGSYSYTKGFDEKIIEKVEASNLAIWLAMKSIKTFSKDLDHTKTKVRK